MVTIARRLMGVVFVLLAVAIFLHDSMRGSFVCERATATCVHTLERALRTPERHSIPVADVLGAAAKWSYWLEADGAREHLANVRSREELDPSQLYRARSTGRNQSTTSGPVIFTRKGLVALLPGFRAGQVDTQALNAFVDGQGDRVELVQDDRLAQLPLAVILVAIGLVLVLLRGPTSLDTTTSS